VCVIYYHNVFDGAISSDSRIPVGHSVEMLFLGVSGTTERCRCILRRFRCVALRQWSSMFIHAARNDRAHNARTFSETAAINTVPVFADSDRRWTPYRAHGIGTQP